METCDHVVRYGIADIAGLYSTLAGVLAGFAFTALIVLVTFRLQDPESAIAPGFSYAAQLMVAAFLGLTLTSLGYAALGGDIAARQLGDSVQGPGGRAATGELLLGVAFAVCATLLIYALVHTLEAADAAKSGTESRRPFAEIADRLRLFGATLMLPLFVAGLLLGSQDYQEAHFGDAAIVATRWLNVFAAGLVLIQLILGGVVWLARRGPKKSGKTSEDKPKHEALFAYGMLSLVVVNVLGFTVITAALEVCDTLPPAVVAAVMTVFSLAAGISAFVFARPPLRTG
jgi:hypothetical protein